MKIVASLLRVSFVLMGVLSLSLPGDQATAKVLKRCTSYFLGKTAPQDIQQAKNNVNSIVLGQSELIDKVFIAMLVGGHVLVSGPTGIAKTTLVKAVAAQFNGVFKEEQMTNDTSITDLKGFARFNRKDKINEIVRGSLFGNFILIDEVSRTPPRTQNAVLSAMQEGKIAIDGRAHTLSDVYFVLATKNPDGSLGTYPLTEALVDRFLLSLNATYTDLKTEREIVKLVQKNLQNKLEGRKSSLDLFSLDVIRESRRQVLETPVSEEIYDYIFKIIDITRQPYSYRSSRSNLINYIESGAGPRASTSLTLAAQGTAWLRGKSEVTREDVDFIAKDVLRHRIGLNRDAKTEDIDIDAVIEQILEIAKRP